MMRGGLQGKGETGWSRRRGRVVYSNPGALDPNPETQNQGVPTYLQPINFQPTQPPTNFQPTQPPQVKEEYVDDRGTLGGPDITDGDPFLPSAPSPRFAGPQAEPYVPSQAPGACLPCRWVVIWRLFCWGYCSVHGLPVLLLSSPSLGLGGGGGGGGVCWCMCLF